MTASAIATCGLYGIAQDTVEHYQPQRLVIALDPVNFEKPYTQKLEGVSTVRKSTPPGRDGQARLTPGYPALTATIVNLPEPVISYADWFSYETDDFLSENWQLYRAVRTSCALFPDYERCFLGDSGLDDQKLFRLFHRQRSHFIIRLCQERNVHVYNEAKDTWESAKLKAVADKLEMQLSLKVTFTHARKQRSVNVQLGWQEVMLPATGNQPRLFLFLLVIRNPRFEEPMLLLTDEPIYNAAQAKQVYTTYYNYPQKLDSPLRWIPRS